MKIKDFAVFGDVYGIIATYGVRPHEVFHILNLFNDFQIPGENTIVKALNGSKEKAPTIVIGDNTKTGFRVTTLPLKLEWVEEFNLRIVPEFPSWWYEDIPLKEKQQKISSMTVRANEILKKAAQMQISLYDLRHAYAIRTKQAGIPLLIAAKSMGHSANDHEKTYHSSDTHTNSIHSSLTHLGQAQRAMNKQRELELEIEQLKIENNRLRLALQAIEEKVKMEKD